MTDVIANRRDLLLGTLLAAAASCGGSPSASAAGVDPAMTIVKLPDQIPWRPSKNIPPEANEQADLVGSTDATGQYFVLVRWHPGFMSAPHFYETDRLCVVVSGTWFVASGADFAPESTVPAPAGSFVRRVANTPHYDGVRSGAADPAVIAITGIGPIHFHLVDPTKPAWRAV